MRGDQLEELPVTIPPGIRSGTRLRLKGKGFEDTAGTRGDICCRITVTRLTSRITLPLEREAIALAPLRSHRVNPNSHKDANDF